jgi:hypothetical protein
MLVETGEGFRNEQKAGGTNLNEGTPTYPTHFRQQPQGPREKRGVHTVKTGCS